METMVIKRKRDTPESELRYRQNKRIMNEGLNSLSLSRYTAITDVDTGSEYAADYDVSPPPSSSSRRCSNKFNTNLDTKHDNDADDLKTVEEEYMLSVIKGGQKKYLRKVDFLVDELIRKSSRSEFSKSYCPKEFDSQLPAAVGPSPTTDHALSNPFWLVNYLENGGKVQCTAGVPALTTGGTPASPRPQDRKPNTHAGDTTHTDWGIIELPHSGYPSPFKSPEAYEQRKQSYYSNSATNSSESVDNLPVAPSSAMLNNSFRNAHSNAYDSDSDAMEQDEEDHSNHRHYRPDIDDDPDNDHASIEPHRSSVVNSRQNSIDSNYSDVSALSEVSNGANNPYYVDPEDNVYFMLNGDITATPHKRRDNRSYNKDRRNSRGRDRNRLIAELREQQLQQSSPQGRSRQVSVDDEDQMNDGESAGGYKYLAAAHKNLDKDLATIASGDAVFCID